MDELESLAELELSFEESPLFVEESPVALVCLSEPPLSDPPLSEPAPSGPLPAVTPSRAFERAAAPRSFFAQPLPLKWIVGGANAFRTGEAPQIGQAVGPSAVTEWTTSKRWPFGQR